MKKFQLMLVYLLLFVLGFTSPTSAQYRLPQGSLDVTVGAQVGEYYLSLSGYASPYASIVLTSNGVLLRSTVADQYGNFSISQVLISPGFSSFCLTAVDFKRIGDSEACIDIPPATGDVTITDIFLPPTIGISKKTAVTNEEVLIYGYSMPNITVTLTINNGETVEVQTDSTGYYQYSFTPKTPGTYRFKATGVYKNIPSLPPKRDVVLTAISLPQKVTQEVEEKVKEGLEELVKNPITFLIFVGLLLFLILLLIVTILKKKGKLPLPPGFDRFFMIWGDKFKKHKPLHHDWLLEFLHTYGL